MPAYPLTPPAEANGEILHVLGTWQQAVQCVLKPAIPVHTLHLPPCDRVIAAWVQRAITHIPNLTVSAL